MIEDGGPRADRLLDQIRAECVNNEQFLDLLVHKMADVAAEKVERANSRTRNRLAVLMTIGGGLFVAAVTGVATFGFTSLKETVKAEAVTEARGIAVESADEAAKEAVDRVVSPKVDQAVAAKLEDAEQDLEHAMRVFELYGLSKRAKDTGFLKDEEAQKALALLSNYADNDAYAEFAQLPSILEEFVDHFAALGRLDLVQRLEEEFGEVMSESWGIAFTMTQSLGHELISFPVLPSDLGPGKMRADWESLLQRYYQYADASRRLRYPEAPYLFDVVLACMQEATEPEIAALVARSADLIPEERAHVQGVLESLVSFGESIEPTQKMQRAKDRVLGCLGSHLHHDRVNMLNPVLGELAMHQAGDVFARQEEVGAY